MVMIMPTQWDIGSENAHNLNGQHNPTGPAGWRELLGDWPAGWIYSVGAWLGGGSASPHGHHDGRIGCAYRAGCLGVDRRGCWRRLVCIDPGQRVRSLEMKLTNRARRATVATALALGIGGGGVATGAAVAAAP